ncbi:MAG: hypothetical protein AB8G18_02835 [Gammaproteobacteria bacterium]
MKIHKLVLALCALVVSFNAQAIDCPAGKVDYLQVQGTGILIRLEGQGWHLLGTHFTSTGDENLMLNSLYAGALAAQMSERQVVVRYPNGYDCSATDYNTPALMLRTL